MGADDEKQQPLERKNAILAVNPKPRKGLISSAVDLVEKAIVYFMHDSSKPHHWLSGNFAPVPETPPRGDLTVRGTLPECLNGEFVRVGPNPKFMPVAGYHWFDGDGMIHGMHIKDGKATYVSRYVRTSRIQQEEFFGGSKFMKIGDLKGLFGLFMVQMQMLRAKLKVLDVSYGIGTGNTALIYHHGKLLALSEADKPYVVKVLEDGDLQTLGMLDYDKRLSHSFTAHPKVDPFTDEMFTFGYSHSPPYVTYRVISKDDEMHDPVAIRIPEPIMMHDFAITENYAIFMDLPLYFRPKDMVKENKLIFTFDNTKKARFGILPRYSKDDNLIRWFELPNCFIFHNANAWEEGDEVVLITCRLQNPDLDMVSGSVKDKLENFTNELYEMRFNMKSGAASQKQLSVSAVDFPRINESYTGRKQRYVYCTILDNIAKVKGIIKFDLHAEPESGKKNLEVGGNVQGIFDLGPGRYGSEAVFVPRKPGITSEEDDAEDGDAARSDAKVVANSSLEKAKKPHVHVHADHKGAESYPFRQLATATRNFNELNLIGEGGFGRVYKGKLDSGRVVAVKHLNREGVQGSSEFLVEVLMLSMLRHQNLVTLYGYCAEGDERLMVYEYMPEGSLEDHLFDLPPDRQPLEWNTRVKIAVGAAEGLSYLHNVANPPVIYRDMKAGNILLDENFNPKLSDFGLAKLGPVGDKTHVSTRVMGTYGYCAPDYAMSGKLTLKSDVYSFGVLLFELLSGRRAFDPSKVGRERNVLSWARPFLADKKKYRLLADPLLEGRYPHTAFSHMATVTSMCLHDQSHVRPIMADVVVALRHVATELYVPQPDAITNSSPSPSSSPLQASASPHRRRRARHGR